MKEITPESLCDNCMYRRKCPLPAYSFETEFEAIQNAVTEITDEYEFEKEFAPDVEDFGMALVVTRCKSYKK